MFDKDDENQVIFSGLPFQGFVIATYIVYNPRARLIKIVPLEKIYFTFENFSNL